MSISMTANESIIRSSATVFIAAGLDVDLPPHRAVWCGSSGDLGVRMVDGSDIIIVGVVGGTLLPIQVKQIRSTGTIVTDVLLWR